MKFVVGLVGLMLLLLTDVYSQSVNWCITDSMDSVAIANDPLILERRAELETFTKSFIKQKSKSDEVLVIPVVFHVLHRYGQERISLAQIKKGLEIVNKDFAALNSDLNSVVSEFKDFIGTAHVEFRLANVDPDGNCTTGVVYYDTDLTYKAEDNIKYAIKNWDPSSYLNIWTVASIEFGAAAWSQYPGVTPALDGVVSIYSYIGNGHTLTHEIGHYFNLIHPWGSTNEPGLEENCDMDDNVEDTPNTIGSDGICNLLQHTCGSLDNVQNIMDYSSCDAMFTKSQCNRMRAALNSSISSRNNLWTQANLVKTGTQDGFAAFDCKPIADFSSIDRMFFEGESINFEALNNGGEAASWQWDFEGGEPAIATTQNPVVSYSNYGLYNVKLEVSNDFGEDAINHENIIRIIDTLQGIKAPAIVDMENNEFPYYANDISSQWVFESKETGNWEIFEGANNRALRILNQNNSVDSKTTVITSNINLSEIDNPDYIYFDWAYSQRTAENTDELKVYVSNNAGKNWVLRFAKRGQTLVSNSGPIASAVFEPTKEEWRTGKINMAYNKDDNHIMLKFEMVSGGGNALYVDNIQIGTPIMGLNVLKCKESLSIYPNPATKLMNVSYTTQVAGKYQFRIYNLIGKLVFETKVKSAGGKNVISLDKNELNLPKGIYLVEMTTYTRKLTTQLIIAE